SATETAAGDSSVVPMVTDGSGPQLSAIQTKRRLKLSSNGTQVSDSAETSSLAQPAPPQHLQHQQRKKPRSDGAVAASGSQGTGVDSTAPIDGVGSARLVPDRPSAVAATANGAAAAVAGSGDARDSRVSEWMHLGDVLATLATYLSVAADEERAAA